MRQKSNIRSTSLVLYVYCIYCPVLWCIGLPINIITRPSFFFMLFFFYFFLLNFFILLFFYFYFFFFAFRHFFLLLWISPKKKERKIFFFFSFFLSFLGCVAFEMWHFQPPWPFVVSWSFSHSGIRITRRHVHSHPSIRAHIELVAILDGRISLSCYIPWRRAPYIHFHSFPPPCYMKSCFWQFTLFECTQRQVKLSTI